jgi:hypothetical protein
MAKRRAKKSPQKDPAYALLKEYKKSVMPTATQETVGAHGVGIGWKLVNGKPTNQLALRIYVSKKLPMPAVPVSERVPEEIRFFSRGANKEKTIVTDVIESPPPVFEQDPTEEHRPAPGGVSVDGISGTAGTLGGWVWDTTDDTIVSLSNHHVYGHVAGVDVIQPGPFDGGSTPANKIGDVKRGIQRLGGGDINTVDCAIADADSNDLYDLSVLEIGPAVYAIDVPVMDMLVEKFGRTTQHTFGEITDADLETTVSGLSFDDCCRIDIVPPTADWSAGGDSGSLVFSQTPIAGDSGIKPVVALHFAGPQGGTFGIVCKIQNVFNRLQLTTLCNGAFEAFLDALFETESLGGVTEASEARLRRLATLAARGPVLSAPPPFERRARLAAGAERLPRGLARDVQKRLLTTKSGRLITDFVDTHRGELVTLLAKDGDVRRATVAAFKPLLAGATTTTEVLQRVFTKEDLARLDRLVSEVSRKAGSKLKRALRPLSALRATAERKSMAKVLGISVG